MLVNGMGCLYTGLDVSVQDGALVNGRGFSMVLVNGMVC